MRPDKKKVIDEVWDDDRIRSFLGKAVPMQGREAFDGDPDFYVLLHAYHAMRVDDFARFLAYFVEAGRDPGAKNAEGKTLSEYLQRHKKAGPFIDVLRGAS